MAPHEDARGSTMASSDGTAAAAALKARGFAGILSSESAGVMAVMRQNAKWALVPGYGYGDEDGPDDPMLEEFRAMRRALFTWRDWDTVAPVAYLAPFLQVIRSVETSGPITGCVTPSGASRSHCVESRSPQRVASRATRPRRFRSILKCARAVRASTRDRSRAVRRTRARRLGRPAPRAARHPRRAIASREADRTLPPSLPPRLPLSPPPSASRSFALKKGWRSRRCTRF